MGDSIKYIDDITNKYTIEYLKGRYIAPSIDLLKDYSPDDIFTNEERVRKLGKKLQSTCDTFGVNAKVVGYNASTLAITFKIRLESGVKAKAIHDLKKEFEYELASVVETGYLQEGSNMMKVSIKNLNRSLIGVKDVISSKAFLESASPLTVAAGMNVEGGPLVFDLAETPHLLIAGTTGSGKSVFIDDILLSIIYKSSPDDVRFLLIDPKIVELQPYNGLPHLLDPVISDPDESLRHLFWIEEELNCRFEAFAQNGVKTIDAFNEKMIEQKKRKLPRLLVVIDEFSDMITKSPQFTNEVIDRLASMGRATGIHLILATQLPTSKIVTPQIKSNLPCRASFTVIDGRESRTILNKMGAERLLGNGDMIFSKSETGAVHAQAAYVSDEELKNVVRFIVTNNCK